MVFLKQFTLAAPHETRVMREKGIVIRTMNVLEVLCVEKAEKATVEELSLIHI